MQQWWVEANNDTNMAIGRQDFYNNYNFTNTYRNQRLLQFNKILRMCNMIEGYQIDNRLMSVMQAGDNDPDAGETADQRTTAINWAMRQDNTYEKISGAFSGAVRVGLNLLNVWMDFREDPENGDIKTEKMYYSSFLMDPFWTKMDFSDCDWIWTRRYLSRVQLNSLIPNFERDHPNLGKGYTSKDGKFQYLPQNWYQYSDIQNFYAYNEYWKRDYKTVRKILDKSTGEVAPWNGTREQFQLMRRFNPNIELIKAQVPTVKLHIVVNNTLVYEEKSPYGVDKYPFIPFLGYHNTEVQNYSDRYFGIVRNIRDSQRELNIRRNRLLDIMDAQVQSGLMVKEDSLVNPEDAFLQGPGKVLYFKQSSNLATDVAPIPPPPVAQGWMELIQSIEKEIMDIVGPEELFAQNLGAKEMSGILMKLKMGAGLTGLRGIFDNLNLSQKLVGELFDDMIAANWSEGKMTQILGHAPSEHFFDPYYSKYHCTVEEGELTASQRQFKLLQALQFKQISPEAISDDYILRMSNLQDKKELIQQAQQRQKQAQEAQEMQFLAEMDQKQMLARSMEAKSQNDFAAAQERITRAAADLGLAKERSAQAMQDRAMAALDNAKALKEIEHMDDDRLIKLAEFIMTMQLHQRDISGGEENDSIAESEGLGANVKAAEQSTRVQSQQPQQQPQMQNQ
jgi:hypothetical protein